MNGNAGDIAPQHTKANPVRSVITANASDALQVATNTYTPGTISPGLWAVGRLTYALKTTPRTVGRQSIKKSATKTKWTRAGSLSLKV